MEIAAPELNILFVVLLLSVVFVIFLLFQHRKNKEIQEYIDDLAEKKKILSALWKIQQIIVESLEFREVVQRVANAVLLELGQYGYVIIVLSLVDEAKRVLKRISISETEQAKEALKFTPIPFSEIEIPLDADDNYCVKALREKKVVVTNRLSDLLAPVISEHLADRAQEAAGIKTSIVFPISSKEDSKVIGVLIFSINKGEQEITLYEKEIMRGFADAVGITVQNAQLYTSLEETKEKLEVANEKLKELDILKDEFVSVASHELRTPMTAIKSYLWMALAGKGGKLSANLQRYIDRAYISTDRLIKLVNDMLNVSRIESGRIEFARQGVDMHYMAEDVAEEVRSRADELGLSVAAQMVKELPMAFCDYNKTKEVLMNLVGNSLKFTPKGGKITVSFGVRDGMVETSVADTGKGIAPADIDKLFKKFGLIEQGHFTTTTPSGSGSGLGLYISKNLVELQGGKISVKSQVGQGSTFTFSLPIATDRQIHEFGIYDPQKAIREEVGPGGAGIIPTAHLV